MNDFGTQWIRYNPEKDIYNYYYLSFQYNIFGGCDLVSQWGQKGQLGGRKCIDHCSSYEEANERHKKICRLRVARGYTKIL